MGSKKKFGITLYKKIEKEGSAPCIEEGCKGEIKYVRTRIEKPLTQFYHEETFFYRCTRNCRHHWKAIKSNLDDKPILFMKY